MKLKNIFINTLLQVISKYLFVILLLLLFLLRYFTYSKSIDIKKHYKEKVVIINPLQISESKAVLYTNRSYKIVSYYIPSNLKMGDVVEVQGDKYYSTVYAKSLKIVGASRLRYLYLAKKNLIEITNRYLAEPHASLFNGIMWGTKPDISKDFKNKLSFVGIIHIVVVSGYNLSLVFAVSISLLRKFGIRIASVVGILLALLYSTIVGFDPPVMRALVMGLLMAVGKAYGQVRSVIYILIVSALLMLIYNPLTLLSISFQLTFFATFGILLFSEPFYLIFIRSDWFVALPNLIQDDLVASISAQLAVIPLIIYYFKGVSLVSFVVNPLILWLVPLIMFFGSVFLIVSFLHIESLTFLMAFILQSYLTIVVDFVNFFSSIPHGYLGVRFSLWHIYISYILLLIFYLKLKKFSLKSGGE